MKDSSFPRAQSSPASLGSVEASGRETVDCSHHLKSEEETKQEDAQVGEIRRSLHMGLAAARDLQDPALRAQMRFQQAVGLPCRIASHPLMCNSTTDLGK
jgi:hypothetical protein